MSSFLSACSTEKVILKRDVPQALRCSELREKIKDRSAFIRRVEGRATLKNKEGSLTLLLSLRSDKQFWVEIRSSLGGAFAYLRADPEWVELLVPRKKEIYRLAASEFWRGGVRRRLFLELLPVAIVPELVFPLILSHPFEELPAQTTCFYSLKEALYQLSYEEGLRVGVDPRSFFASRIVQSSKQLVGEWDQQELLNVDSVEFPKKLTFTQRKRKLFEFTWEELSWNTNLGKDITPFSTTRVLKTVDY